MDQTVIPFDLPRMLMGDEPPLFLLEILIRTAVIYLYTLLLIRWVGGRGVSQLSLVEFLLVIALGSAVGDAAFYPDVPMLHAMLVITLVVLINKGLDRLILRHDAAKRVIDGVPVAVLRDGRLLTEGLGERDIGAAEAIAALRKHGIRNLGEVEHVFVEGDGQFSVFRRDRPRPGLPIVPPAEVEPLHLLRDPAMAADGQACCTRCGAVEQATAVLPDGACPHCGHRQWTAPRLRAAAGADMD